MRKTFALFIVLLFVFAVGCAKEAPQEVVDIPSSVSDANPKDAVPAPKVEVKKEEPVVETPVVEEKKEELAPIGNKVKGTEQEAKDEVVPEDEITIKLLANKTMNTKEMTVSAGTTLFWKNFDSWPHQLAVETGKSFDTIRHAESHRMLEGSIWNYTFNDQGTFLVRDIYSGPMRMNVTVQ